MTHTAPPARWYPDPQRPGTLRYWDGTRWTGHRHPAVGGAGGPGGGWRTWAAVAGATVLLLGSCTAALAVAGGVEPTPPTSPSTRAVAAPTPESPAPATASPPSTSPATRTPSPAPSRSSSGPAAAALVPVVGVVDGDTIKVRVGGKTERVRVIGIDTPELRGGECFAQQASSRMQSLVQSKEVRLERDRTQDDRDRYDRLLRHVFLADGRSVGLLLVQGGFAQEYTYDDAYAGQQAYRRAESAAKGAGRGIWSSGCLAPPPAAPKPTTGGGESSSCDIKGNISDEGERIYHVPGQQFYDVTRIDETKGERWFCSETDAREAGWRKSKR